MDRLMSARALLSSIVLAASLGACSDEHPRAEDAGPRPDAGPLDDAAVRTSTNVVFGSTYTALSVGDRHACAVRSDNTIECWPPVQRAPNVTATRQPEGQFIAVAAGFGHDCAIAIDGTVACWGEDGQGETQAPSGTFTAIAAGRAFTCGITTAGSIGCWGQIDPPPSGNFTAIAAGSSSACAIDSGGSAVCWGSGAPQLPSQSYVQIAMSDQLACGLTTASQMMCSSGTSALVGPFTSIAVATSPCGIRPDGTITCGGSHGLVDAQDPPPGRYQQLAARRDIACALTGGEVRCWGAILTNISSTHARTEWIDVGVMSMFGPGVQSGRGCGIAQDGALHCWGPNPFGESSPPPGTFIALSVAPFGSVNGFSVASSQTCAIRTGGALECWGADPFGSFPEAPPAGQFVAVSACADHACAIDAAGALHCWGAPMVPALSGVPSGTFTDVSCAADHACAIAADGTVACWGDGTSGQTAAPPGSYVELATGIAFSCAIAADESLVCWGNGAPPVPVDRYRDVTARGNDLCALAVDGSIVCAGGRSAELSSRAIDRLLVPGCALLLDGSLFCWDETYGSPPPPAHGYVRASLGAAASCGFKADGSAVCSTNTRAHASLALSRISTGPSATCGIGVDQTISCWPEGQAGLVPPGSWSEVGTGDGFACALSAAGSIACWGAIEPPPSGVFSKISAGRRHACALNDAQTIACWGENSAGETEAPAGSFSRVSAGDRETCAIDATGAIRCWGMGLSEAAPAAANFAEVSVGSGVACALDAGGLPTCWGENDEGQRVPGPDALTSISAGRSHVCGLGVDGRPHCWGLHRLFPPDGAALAVSVSDDLTCVVDSDHHVACSGLRADRTPVERAPPEGHIAQVAFDGSFGGPDGYNNCAVALDGRIECTTPPPIPAGDYVSVAIAERAQRGCALRRDGQLACWGLDPAATTGMFRAVSAAHDKLCALRSDGSIVCYGASYMDANDRVIDPPSGSFDAISVAGDHACALRGEVIECWGADDGGQSRAPEGSFASVAVGWGFSCGITTDKRVGCWGTLPFPPPLGEYASYDVGFFRACGTTAGGELVCSGADDSGTRGNGFPP